MTACDTSKKQEFYNGLTEEKAVLAYADAVFYIILCSRMIHSYML